MLRKENRLKDRRRIQEVVKGRKCKRAQSLSMCMLPNNEEFIRIAVAVGKKHIKHAVDRNRIKRQLRSILRDNLRILIPKTDYVFFYTGKQHSPSIESLRNAILTITKENETPIKIVKGKNSRSDNINLHKRP